MTEIVGEEMLESKASYPTEFERNAVCMYRKISGMGCNRCPFWQNEKLCVRPPRVNPSMSLIES